LKRALFIVAFAATLMTLVIAVLGFYQSSNWWASALLATILIAGSYLFITEDFVVFGLYSLLGVAFLVVALILKSVTPEWWFFVPICTGLSLHLWHEYYWYGKWEVG
jgi:hypothetical protein